MPFDDLVDDVILCIIAHLTPWDEYMQNDVSSATHWEPTCPSPHWRSGRRWGSWRDIRALCSTCTRLYNLYQPEIWINMGIDDERWISAPEERGRTTRVHVSQTGHTSYADAVQAFERIFTFLRSLPHLTVLVLQDTFCIHDAYGSGRRRYPLHVPLGFTLDIRAVEYTFQCRICAKWWPPSLSPLFPHLRRLKSVLAQTSYADRLESVTLKLSDDDDVLSALENLPPSIKTAVISPYNHSRKVSVVSHVDKQRLYAVLDTLPNLRTLDICLSAVSLSDHPDPLVHLRQAAVCLAQHGITRGWFWNELSDLDYNQLLGYHRRAWRVDGTDNGTPRIVLAEQPVFLHPVVVRNLDAQGTDTPLLSETWG